MVFEDDCVAAVFKADDRELMDDRFFSDSRLDKSMHFRGSYSPYRLKGAVEDVVKMEDWLSSEPPAFFDVEAKDVA